MMELEIAFGHRQQNRMEEQDRMSQTSSLVTVSSTKDKSDNKLQSFCKRSQSVQRDPNCAVVIRGWLYKRDSTGLKLWKKRWFVLSNYCLFYYSDSREEYVLGSLPLPSYKVFFCSPRECKNRKYAFKVVHQGMRSYFLSADTQEDMLGWVRALRKSACMDTNDIINRRCSSYQDFSQIGGSTESVNPLHLYRSQNKASYTAGKEDIEDYRGRHGTTHSYDTRTRSLSLDRTGVDHFRCHGSGPSTPRSHYELRPHSPVGRVDLRPQVYSSHYLPVHTAESKEIQSDQLPLLPPSSITHNPSFPPYDSAASVCVFPSSMCDKETHTLAALQGDTDMVLTCLCGCDKVLQTLSVELNLLQDDKDHAEFALDMSRIELNKGQLREQHISQKALLQEELVSIRARMCDISREMERVWVDYKRMESELCVFRSHLQHICQFGLAQERSLAQKQMWMMDDILSGLKPNRRRFKALMASHTLKTPPLLHNPSLHPEEKVHWGEELEPPARPPLPLEIESTNKSRKLRAEWAEPNGTMLYSPVTINTQSSTHNCTRPTDRQSVCMGEKQMIRRFEQKKIRNQRNRSSDDQTNTSQCSPVCLTHLMRAELPAALTAQRVCVNKSNPEEDTPNTLCYKHADQSDKNNVNICAVNREADLFRKSEQRQAKLKRISERVLKSALRRSDSAHPLKFIDVEGSGKKSSESLRTDRVRIHGSMWAETDVPETLISLSDIKPSSTNQISTLTINNMMSEETNQSFSSSTSTNQRAEWFLSTSHWQEFIPLNIQEEELSPTNQDSDTAVNQDSNQTSSFAMETLQDQDTPSDALCHQPIGPSADSHMVFHSDHSERELCIYEEIPCKAPKSATEQDGSAMGGAKAQPSNLSTNHNVIASSDVGGRENGAITEEVEEETGSDIISGETAQPIYSCLSKNSGTRDSFLPPRVTVMNTSL